MFKTFCGAIILFILSFISVGCSTTEPFDAVDHVQALLDLEFKRDITGYMRVTGATEEEARRVYEETLDDTLEAFISVFDEIGLSFNDEQLDIIAEILLDFISEAYYEVIGSTMINDDEYSIEISIRPIMNFLYLDDIVNSYIENVDDEWFDGPLMGYFTNILEDLLMSEEFLAIAEVATEEELEAILTQQMLYMFDSGLLRFEDETDEINYAMVDYMIDILEASLSDIEHGELQTITIRLIRGDDGLFYIPDDEVEKLAYILVPIEL